MICDSILDAVGHTPLVRLRRMATSDMAEVLVKFEALNVGGSIKTRTALNMIRDAEARGLLTASARSAASLCATTARKSCLSTTTATSATR